MYSNEEILKGFINNNQTIIRKIYKTQFNIILSWIKKNNGTSADTYDIMQEAFLIILRKLKNDSIHLNCSFSTYLFSICKHLWFQELRHRSRELTLEISDFNDFIETTSDMEFEERKLKIYLTQLNKLEAKCQQLLMLFCEKKTFLEIMRVMGFKNLQAVADKKKNCRKKLIQNLLNCKEYKEIQNEIFINY